ncbi:hypothetical protein [Oryzobacter telluris]|uniref:hypothetical protein n=1 Tax=Oryzobacter telluris TaxID=3149179 RepID=UPI00370D7BB4
MSHHNPWDVRDPAAMITESLRRARARPGDVLVAILDRGDSPEQSTHDVVRVNRGSLPQRHEASEVLREHAVRLAGHREWIESRWEPPRWLLATIICREGRVIPGPYELFWLMAWRYSNHHTRAFDGDVYLVTQHGWTGYLDRRSGFEPGLHATGRPLSVVPRAGDQ